MKIRTIIAAIIMMSLPAAASRVSAQSADDGKMVMGVMTKPWKCPAPVTRAASELPVSVDNSLSRHFPPIIYQIGGSCAQASGIGYMFTYEMNTLLDRDASLPENRFSYLFSWNFLNNGIDEGGFTEEGLSLGMNTGFMTESDFPNQTSVFYYSWATGFEKYLNALKYRPTEFVRLEITDEESIGQAKRYLYNKGVEGGEGGVLIFSGYSDALQGLYSNYSGPSETGYDCIMEEYSTEGAHAMTIAGYDDTVEFTDPDGQIHKGAFIAVNTWGTFSHDDGRYYLPYWFFLHEHENQYLQNDLLGVAVEYREYPEIVFRVALDYTSRNDIALRMGVGNKGSDSTPVYDYPSPVIYNQGNDFPMQGQYGDSGIEIALDFSKYTGKVEEMAEPNYFLTVTRSNIGSELGEGTIESFSVYDYRDDPASPRIYTCESINHTVLKEGRNMFNIPTVEPDQCSYTPVRWLNAVTGQPVAAPFVFRTADGKYAKVRFSEYDRENGTIRMKYVYAGDGSRNFE